MDTLETYTWDGFILAYGQARETPDTRRTKLQLTMLYKIVNNLVEVDKACNYQDKNETFKEIPVTPNLS